MDEIYSRASIRDRILNDLRNIVKQIYHESVNSELSPDNRTYICTTLIKNLDEALRHGLKQLHLGYWKPICKIIHPECLQSVEKLQTYDASEYSGLAKGRAWIALSLKDDSFISYIQCLVTETYIDKYYEDWSILRTNDACNRFLSILSGLDNVIFTFELKYLNKPPEFCNFGVKFLNEDKKVTSLNFGGSKTSIDLTTSSTSLISPVDSGVNIHGSTSDMEQLDDKQIDIDFLNGNIPETIHLRKNKKDTKRHVSFHEDIYKSPEKSRRLKWDSENLRYSWSGEQLDPSILKEVDFSEIKSQQNKSSTPTKTLDITERGTPEGEETPSNNEYLKQSSKSQKSIVVKRFLQSIKKQSKIKHLCKKYNSAVNNFKKVNIDLNLVDEVNKEIEKELECKPKVLTSKNEVRLKESIVKEMIRNQVIYKTFRLKDYLFIVTNANIYVISKHLETKRISFKNIMKILIYPDSHVFVIYETDEDHHVFVTGESELTNEVLGRLEFSMRKNQYDPPGFIILDYEDLSFFKKTLIGKLAIGTKEKLVYCGMVQIDKENDLLNSVLPSTKRGFLMYKDLRAGNGWIPGDFCLKNGTLYLFGENSNFPQLAINIATGCRSCCRTKNPDRPHTFQISLIEKELEVYSDSSHFYEEGSSKTKLVKSDAQKFFSGIRQKVNKFLNFGTSKGNNCALEFAAANEFELCEWLQMIIQASCGDFCEEAHKEDLAQGVLWVTTDSLIITKDVFSNEFNVDIVSAARLRDIAVIRIGESEKDHFSVVEFICMEANSTSGDWILFMNSRRELDKLISVLQSLWKLNEKFPFEYLREGRLISRCKKSQDNLSDNCWAQFLQ